MKVAIVHYWLIGMRGGEKVLEQLCRLYPGAVIFTHAYDPAAVSDTIRSHEVRETFIARMPGGRRNPQRYLPMMPRAIEALDLSAFDLVISSEAGPAKGAITRPDALHLCYCHSPMRYLWDQYHVYRAEAGLAGRLAMRLFAHRLRRWDTASAVRLDAVAANSGFVARRVAKAWGRAAEVIHPPVDAAAFAPSRGTVVADFWLYAGELVGYKRPDLVIEAFTRMGRPLVVIGDGVLRARLEAIAGPSIRFLGRVPAAELKDHYARCRALVYPGVEDFGIVPLEAMAAGRPVLGFRRGGLTETLIEGETGLFFREQSVDAIVEAVTAMEDWLPGFEPQAAMSHAACYGPERFRTAFKDFAERHLRARDQAHVVSPRRALVPA